MAVPMEQEFDFDSFSYGKKRKEPEIKEREHILKKVKPVQKTKSEIKQENRIVLVKCIRAVAIGLVFAIIGIMNVYVYNKCDALDRQINSLQKEYDLVCGENAELSMKLSNMVSVEQLEKVAVEKLGLVKINSADIDYVRTVGESSVIVSSGKEVN